MCISLSFLRRQWIDLFGLTHTHTHTVPSDIRDLSFMSVHKSSCFTLIALSHSFKGFREWFVLLEDVTVLLNHFSKSRDEGSFSFLPLFLLRLLANEKWKVMIPVGIPSGNPFPLSVKTQCDLHASSPKEFSIAFSRWIFYVAHLESRTIIPESTLEGNPFSRISCRANKYWDPLFILDVVR